MDRLFAREETRALFAGLVSHSSAALSSMMTSAFGVLFGAAAHANGWPVVRGGSQQLVNQLVESLVQRGAASKRGSRWSRWRRPTCLRDG
ncbi:hypothetical protein [Nesterenkonia pannonica]|uniref:hypothetical protein n=1 Tax=Nesterenkonia pannonica TaxID=1548602 RepID=UPI002164023C|nr:hypothetical protein [Nesterenkonia pannonica]